MIFSYFLYASLGVLEQFFAIAYYKTAQKNYDGICSILDLFRGAIWLFIISSLIDNVHQNFPLGIAYIIGGAIGDYISLKLEPRIEKLILKVKNKGRRKKRFYLQAEKKQ